MTEENGQPDTGGQRVRVFPSRIEASAAAAAVIARLIERNRQDSRPTVLGLATGSSPLAVYADLVRRHRGGLSFADVTSFNLDEYYPIDPETPGAFHRYMREHLFDHVDIAAGAWHLPDGTAPLDRVEACCREYETRIAHAGGVDLQLLGLGRTGHVGFNEPGSCRESRTRLVDLHPTTRRDNAASFDGAQVPKRAITMGIGTILAAKSVVLLAFGAAKAEVLARALGGPVTPELPASHLREHADVTVFADEAAAATGSAQLR